MINVLCEELSLSGCGLSIYLQDADAQECVKKPVLFTSLKDAQKQRFGLPGISKKKVALFLLLMFCVRNCARGAAA